MFSMGLSTRTLLLEGCNHVLEATHPRGQNSGVWIPVRQRLAGEQFDCVSSPFTLNLVQRAVGDP